MPKPNETIAIIITFFVLAGFVVFCLCMRRLGDSSSDENYDDEEGDDGDSVDLSAYAAHSDMPSPPPPVHAFRGEPGFEARGLAPSEAFGGENGGSQYDGRV